MNTTQITSVSSKGQIVIPNNIRTSLGISTGSKLIVMTDGINLLLRPIQTEKIAIFKRLIRHSERLAKKQGLKKSDVKKIIKKVRHENRP